VSRGRRSEFDGSLEKWQCRGKLKLGGDVLGNKVRNESKLKVFYTTPKKWMKLRGILGGKAWEGVKLGGDYRENKTQHTEEKKSE